MVDHCDSGCCATWFAGWEKTLESAETIPTAQEMPISHLASFIRDSPYDSQFQVDTRAFPMFWQDGLAARMTAVIGVAPSGCRESDLAIFRGIWTYSSRR